MAQSQATPDFAPADRPADHPMAIAIVSSDAPFTWLAAGWRDLRAGASTSIAYGLIFVAAGVALAAALRATHMMYLFLPLATGFMLLGPAATLGLYAISRDIEAGEAPSLTRALAAWRENPGPMLYVGFALLALFMVWLRLSQLAFALTFPDTAGLDAQMLLNSTLFTPDGHIFLAIAGAMGAVSAALAFAGAAFALPMLLDRKVGMVEAVATSWHAVQSNLGAMIVWAALLVALTAAGMLAGFVGLAVTLPLAGHATWHAYRAVIRSL